jgi:hypothetical protein
MDLPERWLLAMLLAMTAWAPLESLKAQDALAPKPNTAPSAQTPNTGLGTKLDEATLGKMFDTYATIAGGWYLEQRCNFLGKNTRRNSTGMLRRPTLHYRVKPNRASCFNCNSRLVTWQNRRPVRARPGT